MGLGFLRRDTGRYSKLGKNRKKIQKWRRPTGRDNKMRLKMFGYPKRPSVGYKKPESEKHLIEGKTPYLVHNMNELEAVDTKNGIVIIASVGAKKRMELIKKAESMKLPIKNLAQRKEAKK